MSKEQLKPAAWQFENGDINKSLECSDHPEHWGMKAEPLYAIPDGYALVPVEALEYMRDQWPGAYRKFYEIAVKDATFPPGSIVKEEV